MILECIESSVQSEPLRDDYINNQDFAPFDKICILDCCFQSYVV